MLAYISMSAELALSWCMGLLQAMKLPLERLGDNQDPEPLQRALTCGLFLHAARRQPDGTCSAGLDTPRPFFLKSSGGPGPQALHWSQSGNRLPPALGDVEVLLAHQMGQKCVRNRQSCQSWGPGRFVQLVLLTP